MNLLEAFIEFIDSIYWDGYAKMIADTDPAKFDWEYSEFVATME